MKKDISPAISRIRLFVGFACILIGLAAILFDYFQGIPFSVFSLTPITVGLLAVSLSLRKRRGKSLPK